MFPQQLMHKNDSNCSRTAQLNSPRKRDFYALPFSRGRSENQRRQRRRRQRQMLCKGTAGRVNRLSKGCVHCSKVRIKLRRRHEWQCGRVDSSSDIPIKTKLRRRRWNTDRRGRRARTAAAVARRLTARGQTHISDKSLVQDL